MLTLRDLLTHIFIFELGHHGDMFGTKRLSEPNVIYCQVGCQKTNFSEMWIKMRRFSLRNTLKMSSVKYTLNAFIQIVGLLVIFLSYLIAIYCDTTALCTGCYKCGTMCLLNRQVTCHIYYLISSCRYHTGDQSLRWRATRNVRRPFPEWHRPDELWRIPTRANTFSGIPTTSYAVPCIQWSHAITSSASRNTLTWSAKTVLRSLKAHLKFEKCTWLTS